MSRIGIIAGSGPLPLLAAREAKASGRKVTVVAIREEADPAVEAVADRLHWVGVGQLGGLIRAFKQDGVSEAIMVGKVRMGHLFTRVRPDVRGALLYMRLKDRRGDSIMEGVAQELQQAGIALLECTRFLTGVLVEQGVLTRRVPTPREWEDIRFGQEIARTVAQLKIGQAVVVKNGTVLAVEAIEGTDAAVRRGAELGREGVVVVKGSRPEHDFRFDVPVIGTTTIAVLREVGGTALAVEAKRTLLLDREETLALADGAGIAVVAT
ncbi:MAG: LpxI family protein [Candidatus Methylomirabilales bacterium]